MEGAADRDAILVTRCQSQEQSAFDEIVLLYQDRIFSYIRHMVASREDAEDLTQEVFVRAYCGIQTFRGHSSLQTWLFRIATNLCVDWLRRRKTTQTVSPPLECLSSSGSVIAEEPSCSELDPFVLLAEEELKARVLEALHLLPERLKTVLVLHEVVGLPYAEVASIVRCPLGTVKSRMFQARVALRSLMLPYLRGEVKTVDRPQ